MSGGSTGANIDPDRELDAAMMEHDTGTRLLFMMKDALSVNGCIESIVAEKSRASHLSARPFVLFAIVCMAHQVVLGMKPVMERLPGVVSTATRLGHLFAGSRFYTAFMEKVKEIADSTEFVEVPILPPGAEAWRRKAANVLERTKARLEMDDEAQEYVLTVLNDDWDRSWDLGFRHFHVPDCPCGGRLRYKASVYLCFSLIIGNGSPMCLIYRWKNFEVATCYMYRAYRCHGILPRGLRAKLKNENVEDAAEQLRRAQAAGEDNFAAARTVRAGK